MGDVALYESHGTYVQSESIEALASRVVHTFEVLDYDIYEGNYALIYKDIGISHQQKQTYEKGNDPYSGAVYYQVLYQNGELPASALLLHNDSQEFTSIGTRVVTYKLHYKIKDGDEFKTFSVDLATLTVSNNKCDYQATGQRIYGVSMQVTDEFIVYSFELHECAFNGVLGVGAGYNYDGPINLEDWNVNQLKVPIWTRSKQVVGLININDGVGSSIGYRFQEEYDILDPEQYACGVVRR
jgi:hypothetical protein